MPLSWNLAQLKAWGEKSGIPFWGTPQAKNTRPYDGRGECKRCNTCSVCPTQARYAPDFTFKQLLERKAITLHDRTLVRKLVVADGGGRSPRIESATGLHRDRPNDVVDLSGEDVRRRLRLRLELAPAAALGLEPRSRTASPTRRGWSAST